MATRTKYARSGDLSIAYQVVGDGPVDLIFVSGYVSHLEYAWEDPGYARYLRRLAAFSRLILFDKRGTGLSDRVAGIAPIEERMDDMRAVMDAVGSERAVLFGGSEGGPMSILFAATYPERTVALVLYGTFVSLVQAPDYPWRPAAADRERILDARADLLHETWGSGDDLPIMAPSAMDDGVFRHWYGTYLRLSASPGAVMALHRMNGAIDVRHVLPTIRVPTLVLHRNGDRLVNVEEGRYVAAHIPDAKFVELPGIDHMPWVGDLDAIVDEVEGFVTGVRPAHEPDRVLATVMVVQIAGAAGEAVARGDRRWVDGQDRFRTLTDRELARFRGRAIEVGDGRVLATFDGPARAIRCAAGIASVLREIGVETRAGVHTGECDMHGDRLSGSTVQLAAWVAMQAAPGEVLVSGTVRGLIAGAGLRFTERDTRTLAGVPGEFRLFSALRDDAPRVDARPVPEIPATLTRREREVLPLVGNGLSNRQIADGLNIGERTVESHVSSILAKLGLTSRAQIVKWLTERHI